MENGSNAILMLLLWSLAALGSLAALCCGVWFYVKRRYAEFCLAEDRKERIEILRKKIMSAREYVRENYGSGFDSSVPDNIIPKTDFIEKLIMKKSPEEQEKELKFLVDMLTETFVRLRSNYDDVRSVLAPLNTMRDRLVREHLQFIKDHMPDGLDI